jgi:uncharacterized membrane protein
MFQRRHPEEYNPIVAIGASLGGIIIAIVAIFLIFASEQAGALVPIVIAIAAMGVILGYFASKKK